MASGVGLWPKQGMHRVVAPSTALTRGKLHATHPAVIQPFNKYGGACSFGS